MQSHLAKSPGSVLSAMVKGFLTRKLYHCNKVQFTVTTIKVRMQSMQCHNYIACMVPQWAWYMMVGILCTFITHHL